MSRFTRSMWRAGWPLAAAALWFTPSVRGDDGESAGKQAAQRDQQAEQDAKREQTYEVEVEVQADEAGQKEVRILRKIAPGEPGAPKQAAARVMTQAIQLLESKKGQPQEEQEEKKVAIRAILIGPDGKAQEVDLAGPRQIRLQLKTDDDPAETKKSKVEVRRTATIVLDPENGKVIRWEMQDDDGPAKTEKQGDAKQGDAKEGGEKRQVRLLFLGPDGKVQEMNVPGGASFRLDKSPKFTWRLDSEESESGAAIEKVREVRVQPKRASESKAEDMSVEQRLNRIEKQLAEIRKLLEKID